MSKSWLLALALWALALGAQGPGSQAAAAAEGMPGYRVVAEDVSEQRRQVSVRIERRLKEAELIQIGDAIRARHGKIYARTIISFFLPGQELQQGSWATVATTTESKVTVNGLRREDEDVLVAEHRSDKRPLLGSWLTSPPAAPGRLTIFSDDGRILGEWRLRNGQRTVDELADVSTRTERRFEVPGGSTYVLTRSGELEIWEKSSHIATAELIRPDYLAPPPAIALGFKSPAVHQSAIKYPPVPRPVGAAVASPAQPEPPVVGAGGPAAPGGSRLVLPVGTDPAPAGQTAVAAGEPKPLPQPSPQPSPVPPRSKPKPHKVAKPSDKPSAPSHASRKGNGPTPGEQVAAKLGAM